MPNKMQELFSSALLLVKQSPEEKTSTASAFRSVRFQEMLNFFDEHYDQEVILDNFDIRRQDLCRLKETDDELAQLIRTRRLAAVSVPWSLNRDDDNANFIKCQLEPIIDKVSNHSYSAVEYGYAVQEVNLKQDGSFIVFNFIEDRPLEWFKITKKGVLIHEKNGKEIILDTTHQFILTRNNPTYRNAYGESQLAQSYWAHWFRFNGWRFYMQYLERHSDPLLLGKMADHETWVKRMTTAGYTHVVGVPVEGDVSAVTQSAADDFENFERIITGRMQKIWNGQSVTTQIGAAGARAQAIQSNEITEAIDMAHALLIEKTCQQLVNTLHIANGFPDLPPRFIKKKSKGVQVERSQMDLNLKNQGVKFKKAYYVRNYDIHEDEFEITEVETSTSSDQDEGDDDDNSNNLTRNLNLSRRTDAQLNVDNIVETLIPKLNTLVNGEAIVDSILSATDEESLLTQLSEFAKEMNTEEAQQLTHDALLLVDAIGYVSIAAGVATD